MFTDQSLPFAATVPEACRLSGLGKSTLYELMRDGTIQARKRGTTTLVLVDSLRRYIEGLPPPELKVKVGAGTKG